MAFADSITHAHADRQINVAPFSAKQNDYTPAGGAACDDLPAANISAGDSGQFNSANLLCLTIWRWHVYDTLCDIARSLIYLFIWPGFVLAKLEALQVTL